MTIGDIKQLQNEQATVEITALPYAQKPSTDSYDILFDPFDRLNTDDFTVFLIRVGQTVCAAVGYGICPLHKSAILNGNELIVLQNRGIFKMDVTAPCITHFTEIECFGGNRELHECERGYVVYGETVVQMLSHDLERLWERSGADIFASVEDPKGSFRLTKEAIYVKDFQETVYAFDFDGRLISETPRRLM